MLGVSTTLLGILLAYDSSYWDPASQGLPVSFFIVSITFVGYLVSGLPVVSRLTGRRQNVGQSTSPKYDGGSVAADGAVV